MKRLELRLALVLYGGVSLAVYMHGVTREILNLVRASRRCEARMNGRPTAPCDDTIAAYEHALDLFAPELDLRVVVDVISGASAGGVNGVMLARALAHNLPLDAHRDLWLENADVTQLGNDPVGLTRYLKSSITPVLDRLVSMALKADLADDETRAKLRQFMQSRWFTPPFSGERYIGWMLDACHAMLEDAAREGEPETLIPAAQSLDLFVTMTDFYGARRRFAISAPSDVEEVEHRTVLRYRATRPGDGDLLSDFDDQRIPDLVFAARATSAFPGAFPPMTIGEMERVLEERGDSWAQRDLFCTRSFGSVETARERVLVDGSVVMNKPFQPLLEAIAGRPAGREVVRRIVYIDPTPLSDAGRLARAEEGKSRSSADPRRTPGFFRVILASLAHIPRNEPIGDALEQVVDHNREVRRIADVIAAAEPLVEREVKAILRPESGRPLTVRELARCRAMSNERAHATAGYAALGYQRLKRVGITDRLSELCHAIAARAGTPIPADLFKQRFEAWLDAAAETDPPAAITPEPIIRFLRGLDVDYRIRRLRFVIRRLNQLYRSAGDDPTPRPAEMDELKSTLYEQVGHLTRRWSDGFYGRQTEEIVFAFAASEPENLDATTRIIDHFADLMGLTDLDQLSDDVFSVMVFNYLPEAFRQSLVGSYVGFAFYDLVTLPVLRGAVVAEHNEIEVDRISPADPTMLRPQGLRLKGANLNAFGAFFNRRWREHDYVWGRLTAADRLISMAVAAAAPVKTCSDEEVRDARLRLFRAILEEERAHLKADGALIPALADEVARLLLDETRIRDDISPASARA